MGTDVGSRPATPAWRLPWKTIGVATFAGAAFLLLSFGGAIIAAPVTLPLMYLASRRHPTRTFRGCAVVIGALTAAETAWALTYVAVEESRPWIWLVPTCSAALAASIYISRGSAPVGLAGAARGWSCLRR